ncbi:hypothetical protein PHLCEN_2v10801 [Hermanssonia centrifuga]|uniref:Leucine zipper with capping helix domain-containing protein n=1 Tax=Hermanssonia centrifuga TaxID=98765 RepID=A0A2R6NLT0_9APHY|nr:hypothetical protein PHLCEN_2v10801 [Hermanssonia centrifuga]
MVKESQKTAQAQLSELQASIEVEKVARPDSTERSISLAKLSKARQELTNLEKETAKYGACDPAKVEEKKRAVVLAKEASIRWTDNYAVLMSHFTRQHGVDPEELKKFLGVSEDYEDIL